MTRRGLYIGRFNPPHLGHIEALKAILKENGLDQLIVGIGSAQKSFTENNPFTAGERFEMLSSAIKEAQISNEKLIIVPILDLNNNNQFISYLKSLLPDFSVIYSNNPLVVLLTKEDQDLDIKSVQLINREKFSSSNIRKKIVLDDDDWKSLLPKSVLNFILEINGIDRIKALSTNDLG